MKSFTTIRNLGRSDLETLVADAIEQRRLLDEDGPIAKILADRCVANLFFEPSTRTRLSFDLAAKRLGAHVITLDPVISSTTKGESLRDTVLTLAGIGADFMVVRHAEVGVPQSVAEWTGLGVVNAGDGVSEHPTQALLDVVTLHRRFGRLDGLRLAIVGDIAHSRVAGSLLAALGVLGVDVTLAGPERWLPEDPPVRVTTRLDDVLADVEALYLLRVQTERGGQIDEEYIDRYRIDAGRASRMQERAVVMHPGPVNRGVEVSDEVVESARSQISEQVRNGVPSRMAVLRALAGGEP